MKENFEMVAKTFQGLEDVLAEELRGLGAENVEPGRRMVSFQGDLEMLYRANLCCRTALRILKPIHKFTASDTDQLYELTKQYDWGSLMTPQSTFSIDTVAYSDEFTHSRFVTYRVKDAIVDWFCDRFGEGQRPGVRLQDADVMINVHIAGDRVTLSLDSSGESLHKRGYRVAQTEAPINEVLAAGIILKSGWRGDCPLVDPMCGSGTFLIEAAMIAANINPGVYRRHFSFENWKDFDPELFDSLYNDDSGERPFNYKIYGADISPKAIEIARRNIKSAGVGRMISLETKPLSAWDDAPADGVLITNPPYGERISADDMEGLYRLLGSKLKNIFKGYHAWIIAAKNEYIHSIGLSPSVKEDILNGSIECELREYIIFEGDYKHFRSEGNRLRSLEDKKAVKREERRRRDERTHHRDRRDDRREERFGDRSDRFSDRGGRRFHRPGDNDDAPRRHAESSRPSDRWERRGDRSGTPRNKLEERYRPHRSPRAERAEGRSASRSDRPSSPRSDRPSSPRSDRFAPRTRDFSAPREASDNPLASRRNEDALRAITNRRPTLPPAEGPLMRPRRGWKKTDK